MIPIIITFDEMIPEFHILCPQCTILYTFVYISTVEMIPLALHAEKRHVTPLAA